MDAFDPFLQFFWILVLQLDLNEIPLAQHDPESSMLAFFLEGFETRVTIDGDRLAVTFVGFAVVVPCSRGGIHVIRVRYGIKYANRRRRAFVALTLVIIAMHVRNSESPDVFGGTFRLVSDPALRRVRQNGEQFLIFNGVGNENRFVLSVHDANLENDKQRQCEQTRTRGGAKLRLRNESRRFHANLFLPNERFSYTIDFTAAVKTLWTMRIPERICCSRFPAGSVALNYLARTHRVAHRAMATGDASKIATVLWIFAVMVRLILIDQPYIDHWSWRESAAAAIGREFR